MSGKLVGEVLDASARLQESGLPERAFHALVAIAEKCHTDTRQGSVRWDHIRAGLYGSSKRTAERAVAELKSAGLVTVVRVGFNNNRGRACAPIYAIPTLTDTDTAVTQSVGTDTDTAVSDTGGTDTAKPGTDTAKTGDRYRHLGVVLDGPIDGSTDGEAAAPPVPANFVSDELPEKYCPAHMPVGTIDRCGACGAAGRIRTAAIADKTRDAQRVKDELATAVANCELCDEHGWRLGDDQSVDDRNIRCTHQKDGQEESTP